MPAGPFIEDLAPQSIQTDSRLLWLDFGDFDQLSIASHLFGEEFLEISWGATNRLQAKYRIIFPHT
jgi:hypothetical protein